jgi:competence ComEA-like helix-hairpin-helix protein
MGYMWKKIETAAHRFGFTKNEAVVVLFLSTALIAGSVLSYIRSGNKTGGMNFLDEYKRHDSLFAAASSPNTEPLRDIDELNSSDPERFHAKKATKKELVLQYRSVNINTAGLTDLTLLPGIGTSTAERILEYRRTHKGFKTIRELMNIKNIGLKKFNKLKLYICVDR